LVITPAYRKLSLYFIILIQLTFIIWVLNIFPMNGLIFWPYHSNWNNHRWLHKLFDALLICWIALVAIYLQEKRNKIIAQ
jgi:hypothetical protein